MLTVETNMPEPIEVVPHEKNHANNLKEFFSQNELLSDPVTRRDYFEHLDDKSFIELLQQTANIVRTGESAHQLAFDGEYVALKMHKVPDQRDKMDALMMVWDAAKGILSDRDLTDQEALDYAGLTVAGGVLLTHPYRDGNGRTSRTLSYVMMRGNNDLSELEGIIEDHEGGDNWSVNPNNLVPRPAMEVQFYGEQPDKIIWKSNSLDAAEDPFGGSLTQDFTSRDTILRYFIEIADKDTLELVRKAQAVDENDDRTASVIDGSKLLELLAESDGAVEYAKHLKMLHDREKMRIIEGFLAGMKYASLATYPDKISMIVEKRALKKLDKYRRGRRELAGRALSDGTVSIRDQNIVMHKARSRVYDSDEKNNLP